MRIHAILALTLLVGLSACDSVFGADEGDSSATITGSGVSVAFDGGEASLADDGRLFVTYSRSGDSFFLGLYPVGAAELGVGTFDIVPFSAGRTTPAVDGFNGTASASFGEPLDGISFTRSGTLTVESASDSEVSGTIRLVTADVGESSPEELSVEATFRAVR